MSQIFISYSRRDTEIVDSIVQVMRDAGLDVWIDRHDIHAGNTWRVQIVQAIDTCDAFVLMLSPSSAASDNVRREIDLALDSGRTIFPILLEPVRLPAQIRYQLAGLQFIDVQMLGREPAINQLISTIRAHIAKLHPAEELKTQQAELVIQGIDLAAFDSEKQEQLLGFLAQLVKTNRSELTIAGLTAGSVHVFVELPSEDAFELKTLALNRDKRFKKFGITAMRLVRDKKFVNIALGLLTATATIGVLQALWLSIPSLSPFLGVATGKFLTILLAASVIAVASVSLPAVVAPFVSRSPTPTPTPTATLTATPAPTATVSSPPTGTSTLPANQPPVIERVELREERSPEKLVFRIDVYFQDADGDANFVDYEQISSSVERSFDVRDSSFAPSSDQKEGKVITGTWTCGRRINYEVTLAITIHDAAGHQSNVVETTIKCNYVESP